MSTSTDAPGGRVAAPGWVGGDRLPVAPRQRRPGLAILAVVLILGGALFSAALVLRSGAKVSVVVMGADVTQGEPFEATDFRQAQIAPGGIKVIKWAQRGTLIGKTAAVDIKSGTLLNVDLTGDDPQPRAGYVISPATLKAAQMPGIRPGDRVRAVWAPPAGQTMDGAPVEASGWNGIIVDKAIVWTVSGRRADGTFDVNLVIPEGNQSKFSRYANRQDISLVKLNQAG